MTPPQKVSRLVDRQWVGLLSLCFRWPIPKKGLVDPMTTGFTVCSLTVIYLFHDNLSWEGWEITARSGASAGIIIGGGGADGISSTSIITVILLCLSLLYSPVKFALSVYSTPCVLSPIMTPIPLIADAL